MTRKHRKESGGVTKDYINTYFLLGVGLFNLINQILEGKDIMQRSYLTIPFFVFALLIYWNKTSRVTKSILFLLAGIAYQMAVPDQTYLGASVFFIISFFQHVNNKHGIGLIMLSLIAVVVKATFSSATPSQTIVSIIAFMFIYVNVFFVIEGYKKQFKEMKQNLEKALKGEMEPIRNIDIIDISQEEKAILHLFCRGYDYNKIQKTLGLNIAPNSVRRKITAIKTENKDKIMNVKDNNVNINDAQFGKWLYETV